MADAHTPQQRSFNRTSARRNVGPDATGVQKDTKFVSLPKNVLLMETVVKGIYENGRIVWDEEPPVKERTKVIVRFLENETDEEPQNADSSGKKGIQFGSLAGKVTLPPDFNEPLDDLSEYM